MTAETSHIEKIDLTAKKFPADGFTIVTKTQLSEFDLTLLDISGTTIGLHPDQYWAKIERENIYEALAYHIDRGMTYALNTDGFTINDENHPDKSLPSYVLDTDKKLFIRNVFEQNVVRSESTIKKGLFPWIDLCEYVFGTDYIKETITTKEQRSEYEEKFGETFPAHVKHVPSIAEKMQMPLEKIVMAGDGPDLAAARVLGVAYFPIPSIGSYDFKNMIP